MRQEVTRHAFNRGLISDLALGRTDLKRSALSAALQTNWVPRALGPMMLRVGFQYIGATASNAASRSIEFVRSLTGIHMLEFTASTMRVWTNDVLLTRVSVSTAVTNGDFTANLGSWTDNDDAGGTSAWVTGGYMGLTGNGTARAIRDQAVTVAAIDQAVEHALRIVIERGPVVLRVGSTSGADDLISETTLLTGTHSLAFTPLGATFYIRFQSALKRQVLVDSCNVESSGTVTITSPYLAADLDNIRANTDSLSVDVMFMACSGYQQRRVERRNSGRSWSLVRYQPEDGPFRAVNTDATTMTASVLSGNGTLTASRATFKTTHAGALFRLESVGQTVTADYTSTSSGSVIRVTGVGTDRTFAIAITGLTATGNTMVLQRSFDNASWTAVPNYTWTIDAAGNYADSLDNQIVYYRLTCTVYAAGTTVGTLTYAAGSIAGICRVTAFTSATVVDMEVLTDFGATTATSTWYEGEWSDYRGWPSAGTLYEGRLGWGGLDKIIMSESDAFDAFSLDTVGDSASINRTIGSGPLDRINWMLPLQRLILGTQMAEHSVRSTIFDEVITPTNFNRKPASKKGSSNVQACSLGNTGFFVGRAGSRVYNLEMSAETSDYHSVDVTMLNPEVCKPMVVRMAVQIMPDIRLHCILSDGTAAVLVYDSAEKVECWIKVETDGDIEDVCVLPGAEGDAEDVVYYTVNRTINSATVRYVEKWALEENCQGGTLNQQADAFVTFTNTSPSATITGLTHLIGESVIVWADGICLNDSSGDIATFTVNGSGEITVTHEGAAYLATTGVVGLAYRAQFQSAKLGDTLGRQKNVDHIACVLKNTHAQGLKMGPDFTLMDNLPLMYQGAPVDPDSTYPEYDEQSQEFPGEWNVDSRICLEANAPRNATVLACVISGQISG